MHLLQKKKKAQDLQRSNPRGMYSTIEKQKAIHGLQESRLTEAKFMAPVTTQDAASPLIFVRRAENLAILSFQIAGILKL